MAFQAGALSSGGFPARRSSFLRARRGFPRLRSGFGRSLGNTGQPLRHGQPRFGFNGQDVILLAHDPAMVKVQDFAAREGAELDIISTEKEGFGHGFFHLGAGIVPRLTSMARFLG